MREVMDDYQTSMAIDAEADDGEDEEDEERDQAPA